MLSKVKIVMHSNENEAIRPTPESRSLNCDERIDTLVIVVPYRDRLDHLRVFVSHMESFLRDRPFRLLIIEQADEKPFNRGKLCNVGFTLTSTQERLCLHDVDMLAVDDSCDYSPFSNTTHLAGCVQQFGFRMPYAEYLGGVLLVTRPEFERANGYSNEYWGWGNEDDDLYMRYRLSGSQIIQKPGRYLSLLHPTSHASDENNEHLARALAFAAAQITDSGMLQRIRRIQTNFPSVSVESAADYRAEGLCNLQYRVLSRHRLSGIINFPHTISGMHELVRVEL